MSSEYSRRQNLFEKVCVAVVKIELREMEENTHILVAVFCVFAVVKVELKENGGKLNVKLFSLLKFNFDNCNTWT